MCQQIQLLKALDSQNDVSKRITLLSDLHQLYTFIGMDRLFRSIELRTAMENVPTKPLILTIGAVLLQAHILCLCGRLCYNKPLLAINDFILSEILKCDHTNKIR